ncbi:hypothetical protein [Bifidobacterium sp. SO4]|uniref:hypothetical protein n=1 Tax=Bifidobacterium sp. SO4 TaxID=2809030 RepID=UPI001BDBC7C2|nr:hypothetical protein [Bifidobacterium sp. SO4]
MDGGGYTVLTEPEWDDTERAWMLALADYEASLCPSCGLPKSECSTPDAEFRIHADAHICWTTAHQQQALRQWREEHADSQWADALVTTVSIDN